LPKEDIPALLRTAIETARSGNPVAAREMLRKIVGRDSDNEMAWLWLVAVAESDEERLRGLRRALAINPHNQQTRQALEQLERRRRGSAAPANPEWARLRGTPRQKRGLPRWAFWTLALVAVGLLAAGLALLYLDRRAGNAPLPPATATRPPDQPAATRVADYISPTPLGGALRTLPPRETLPPTWTPTATRTPTRTPQPSPTQLPLGEYTLLVSAQRGGGGWALRTLRADGSDEQALSLTLPPGADPALSVVAAYDAVYSPDGQQIAFTAQLAESRLEGDTLVSAEFEDLFVAPARGGALRRLTTFAAPRAGDAAWSPDGQTIACAANPNGDFDVFLVSVETGAVTTLISGQSEDREPAWSPDGRWVAFTSDRSGPGATEVWRIEVASGALKQLTDNINSSFSPAWSPDGSTIVFLSDRRATTDLYYMTANGDGERSLLPGDVQAEERDPAWSPDGRWIAFSSNRAGPAFNLYVVRPDGSELQPVVGGDGEMRYAAWRPADG
jgi:Tol biopolymer transport system component